VKITVDDVKTGPREVTLDPSEMDDDWLRLFSRSGDPDMLAELRRRKLTVRSGSLPGSHADQNRDEHGRFGESGGLIAAGTTKSALSPEAQARVDEKLAALGVTQKQLEDEIASRVTPEALAKYGNWYPEVHATLAASAAENHMSIEQACAITAAASPQMPWDQNLAAAQSVMAYADAHQGEFTTGKEMYAAWADATAPADGRYNLYGTQGAKCFDLAMGNSQPEDALTTAKVSSFYDNLMEPDATREVTVDTHMLKAVEFASGGTLSTAQARGFYGASMVVDKQTVLRSAGAVAVSEAVRTVADRLGLSPDRVQATYWSIVQPMDHPVTGRH
jgi:hypothetical protein